MPASFGGKKMSQTRVSQYLNEIVSLTIMGLMLLALAGGTAGADAGRRAGAPPGGIASEIVSEKAGELVIAVDFRFRHEGE